MKKLPLFLFIAAIAFVAYAMVYLKDGNVKIPLGKKTTETKNVDEFDKIQVEGVFVVDVTYGSEEEITIDAPDNIQNLIQLKVKAGTLHIKFKGNQNINLANSIKVHIKTEVLNDFSLSGASTVKLNNTLKDASFTLESSGVAAFIGDIEVSEAAIELDGAAFAKLSGTAEEASLELSGASQLQDFDFEVRDLKVDLSGASSAKMTSLESIRGDISGASSFEYHGDPNVKRLSTSGAASANKR